MSFLRVMLLGAGLLLAACAPDSKAALCGGNIGECTPVPPPGPEIAFTFDGGTVVAELEGEMKAREYILALVNEGYYNNMPVHRMVPKTAAFVGGWSGHAPLLRLRDARPYAGQVGPFVPGGRVNLVWNADGSLGPTLVLTREGYAQQKPDADGWQMPMAVPVARIVKGKDVLATMRRGDRLLRVVVK